MLIFKSEPLGVLGFLSESSAKNFFPKEIKEKDYKYCWNNHDHIRFSVQVVNSKKMTTNPQVKTKEKKIWNY